MKRLAVLSLSAAVVLSGCATSAERIAPAPIADGRYTGASCSDLTAQAALIDSHYAEEARRQTNIRRIDMAGLVLVFLPVASLTGHSRAAQIANLKGDRMAVNAAMARNNCPAVPDPTQ